MTLDQIINNISLMSDEDIKNYKIALNYLDAVANVKNKILSVMVPVNIDAPDEHPYLIKICADADDPGVSIPYTASAREGWKKILLDIGEYMGCDFSDVLDAEGDFLHIFGANGEEINPKLSEEERAKSRGFYVGTEGDENDIPVETENTTGSVPSESDEKIEDAEVIED